MKVDLHIHSCFSPDAINAPRAICRATLRRGLDGIALTDHDTIAGWEAMQKEATAAGILFIPGMERRVMVAGQVVGEVLCLFLCEPVQACDPAGILSEVQHQGGLVVAAHPFDRRRPALGRSPALAEFGEGIAIEVLNGRSYWRGAKSRAAASAAARGLPVTAGSDAHTSFEVGNAYVEAPRARTAEELKQAILSRQVRICGRVSNPVFSLYSGMRKFGVGSGEHARA